eukprot:CAMPEP_0179200768 /NCGR_PEP_ID=MMETSP0796-20121207/99918_1 /TAXON_ID=73915 /ORGANISM="Pyrodinium bahamense, Strain pbaha01" /LENGTH=793 /DNA_ID=CAMNT_0020905325 /DNA_START=81 /DNA_END=2463 /DNA_ORIENTATION=+
MPVFRIVFVALASVLAGADHVPAAVHGLDDFSAAIQAALRTNVVSDTPLQSETFSRCAAKDDQCLTAFLAGQPPEVVSQGVQVVVVRNSGEDLRWLDELQELSVLVYDMGGLWELLPKARALAVGDFLGLARRVVRNARQPYDVDFLSNGARDGLLPLAASFVEFSVAEGLLGPARDILRRSGAIDGVNASWEAVGTAFEEACAQVLGVSCPAEIWVAQGAQWAVSRDRLHSRPRSFYERILQLPEDQNSALRELVLEAVWPLIWGAESWSPGLAALSASKGKRNTHVRRMADATHRLCVFSTDGGPQRACEEKVGFCEFGWHTTGKQDAVRPLSLASSPESAGSWSMQAELRPMITGPAEVTQACPEGYHPVDGDIPGWDQFGHRRKNYTMDRCAQECDAQVGCMSFEWSATTKVCNLNKGAYPTIERNDDYVFCQSKKAQEAGETILASGLEESTEEAGAEYLEQSIYQRVADAWASGPTAYIGRRIYCGRRHLFPPAVGLSIKNQESRECMSRDNLNESVSGAFSMSECSGDTLDQRWELVYMGGHYYKIQLANSTACLINSRKSHRSTFVRQSCGAAKNDTQWELIPDMSGSGHYQIRGKASGRCIAHAAGANATECQPGVQSQLWQLRVPETGRLYEKFALRVVERYDGRLQMRCVLQLNSESPAVEAEPVRPNWATSSQLMRWKIADAAPFGVPGSYVVAADGRNSDSPRYLQCDNQTGDAYLGESQAMWRIYATATDSVSFKSQGSVLFFNVTSGYLRCVSLQSPSSLPRDTMFALGLSSTTAKAR